LIGAIALRNIVSPTIVRNLTYQREKVGKSSLFVRRIVNFTRNKVNGQKKEIESAVASQSLHRTLADECARFFSGLNRYRAQE